MGIAHPVHFHNYQPLASVSQLRAKAYAGVASSLAFWSLHSMRSSTAVAIRPIELALEASQLLLS